jgi:hypothetical protein
MPKLDKKTTAVLEKKAEEFKRQMKEVREAYPVVGLCYDLQTLLIAKYASDDAGYLRASIAGEAWSILDAVNGAYVVDPKPDTALRRLQAYFDCLIAVAVFNANHDFQVPSGVCDEKKTKILVDD